MSYLAPMAGYLIFAGTCALVAKAIHAGWLTPNLAIGVRTKSTLKNERAWNLAHKAMFPYLMTSTFLSVSFLVILGVLSYLNYPVAVLDVVTVTGFVMVLLILAISGFIANNKAKKYNESHSAA